jgi:hypothetical protein
MTVTRTAPSRLSQQALGMSARPARAIRLKVRQRMGLFSRNPLFSKRLDKSFGLSY